MRSSVLLFLTFGSALLCVGGADAKLIELKATFDTSVFPKNQKPFQLRVDNARYIYPEDPSKLLHGTGKMVNLQGETGGTLLQGYVKETPKLTTITTVERGLNARFHLDLSALIPKLAPDLSRQLEAQIAKSGKTLTARVEEQEPAMQKQLAALNNPKTAPVIPGVVPAGTPRMPMVGKTMLPGAGKVDLDAMKPQGGGAGGGGGSGSGVMMPMRGTGGGGNGGGVDIDTQIALAKQKNTAVSDLSGQLISPKINAKVAIPDVAAKLGVPQAYPDLDALSAKAKLLPGGAAPNLSDTKVAAELSGEKAILWDQWHTNFANVAGQAILKAVRDSGNPTGTDTVTVVVYPDQRVEVTLSKPGKNTKFDQAVLSAYKSINHNKTFAYPTGSLRSSVSFLVDHKHTGNGIASTVHSQTARGDKEILRISR